MIHVDGQLYTPVDEWSRTRAEIVRAARAGGAFVPMLTVRGVADVFVSHGATIYAEVVEDESSPPDFRGQLPDFDVDEF